MPHLLTLPLELRNEIYTRYLLDAAPSVRHEYNPTSSLVATLPPPTYLPLLLLNHQIHHEIQILLHVLQKAVPAYYELAIAPPLRTSTSPANSLLLTWLSYPPYPHPMRISKIIASFDWVSITMTRRLLNYLSSFLKRVALSTGSGREVVVEELEIRISGKVGQAPASTSQEYFMQLMTLERRSVRRGMNAMFEEPFGDVSGFWVQGVGGREGSGEIVGVGRLRIFLGGEVYVEKRGLVARRKEQMECFVKVESGQLTFLGT